MCVGADRQHGYTYIGLLVSIVILGLMLTMVARVWSTTEQRERETQLLWIGHAYRTAISSYFSMGHQYPLTLELLLTDDRFPVPKHHLRQLYADPMTGKADWTLIMSPTGQGIMGVASSSEAQPIKRDGFDSIDDTFKDADCYCLWKFVYYGSRWNRVAPTGVGLPTPSPGPIVPTPTPAPTPGNGGAPGIQNPYPSPIFTPPPGTRPR
jgi:type II secretory pathway pseudopilin PulG